MKLSILFEGWEELGIEDPGMDKSKSSSREVIRKTQSYFNTNFPDVEYSLMPSKQVDVQTFLKGQYPFSLFIDDDALEAMGGPRANTFFVNLQEMLRNEGWDLPKEYIQHDDEAGRLVLVILPANFEL